MKQQPIKSPTKRILLMQALLITGFLIIIGLEYLFSSLIHELDQVSNNEQARLFIGEQVVHDIESIETDVYRMTIATGNHAQQRYMDSIQRHIDNIKQAFQVLKHGGTISRTLNLNLDVADQITKSATYAVNENKYYTLELIELEPLVDRVLEKVTQLQYELADREQARQQENTSRWLAQEAKVNLFIKQLPSFFIRLKENAHRLSYETQQRLADIEQDLVQQKKRYEATKLILGLTVILAFIGIGFIVTRQINANNRQLISAWQAMEQAKEEAVQASKAKSEFVSRMSHELRTPLNAILGYAQLLELEHLTSQQTQQVKQINQSGKHLLSLINQVLDIAKIEAGKLSIEHLPIKLSELVESTFAMQRETIEHKGLSYRLTLAPSLPENVLGDPTLLRQILINLIGNAVKFTDQGHITVNVFPLTDEMVRFEIRDTGIGMDEVAKSRLFQAFSQADDSITRRYGGTGLGLRLCKEMVEAQAGEIGVESSLGQGSTFWFTLPMPSLVDERTKNPLTPDIQQTETSKSAPTGSNISKRLDQMRILLVEDNPINQNIARQFLQRLGITPDIAQHGEEALAALKQASYNLVLLDLEMPIMDGYTTISNIRAQEALNETPQHQLVIAMSANALNEDKQRAFQLGVDDYITKPVQFALLKQTLEKWLGNL